MEPLERIVGEFRAAQLFDTQGRRPFDPGLAERLARMPIGTVFTIDPLPIGMKPRDVKAYYNRSAEEVNIHIRWRKDNCPVAGQIVAEPTRDELWAKERRRSRSSNRNGKISSGEHYNKV